MDGVLGIRAWHWLFLLGGLPCILLGLMVLKTLKDRIDDAGWLSAHEKSLLASRISRSMPHTGAGHSLLGAIKTPGFLTLGMGRTQAPSTPARSGCGDLACPPNAGLASRVQNPRGA